jgi:hypothetical protein
MRPNHSLAAEIVPGSLVLLPASADAQTQVTASPDFFETKMRWLGRGGDAMRVGYCYVWLSNGRQHTLWRFLPENVMAAAPHAWTEDAHPSDLDGNGKPDILVEDLVTFIPGRPASFDAVGLRRREPNQEGRL